MFKLSFLFCLFKVDMSMFHNLLIFEGISNVYFLLLPFRKCPKDGKKTPEKLVDRLS